MQSDFVSDAEIARRWGVSPATARVAIKAMEKHPRFPRRDPLFSRRRYWPAVVAFMKAKYGVGELPQVADGEDNFDAWRKRKR